LFVETDKGKKGILKVEGIGAGLAVGDVTIIILETELLAGIEQDDRLEQNWGFAWLKAVDGIGARVVDRHASLPELTDFLCLQAAAMRIYGACLVVLTPSTPSIHQPT
jgi:hypothetical protein